MLSYPSTLPIRIMTDEIKKLLESRHPEYEEHLAHWKFLEETYEA